MSQPPPVEVTSFEHLIARNEARLRVFQAHEFFAMMVDQAVLQEERKRAVLLSCVYRFSSNFQTLMFLRQGLCSDPRYQGVFMGHFNEEFGHDRLLAISVDVRPVKDSIFEALLAWFNYQMIVGDNAERSVLMHLVLEQAGDCFHTLAADGLGAHVESAYFDVHAEHDAAHARLADELLQGLGTKTYSRLATILDQGWDMMEAVVARTRQLVLESGS